MAEVEIKVKIAAKPELLAEAFAKMGSDEQAKTLSMMWSSLRGACGSNWKAEMQCAYIRAEDGFDEEAHALFAALAPAEPEGFVLPVHRDPTIGELIDAKRFVDARLGKPTYTLDNGHNTIPGLSAEEVLEEYLMEGTDVTKENGDWPSHEKLPSEGDEIHDCATKEQVALAFQTESVAGMPWDHPCSNPLQDIKDAVAKITGVPGKVMNDYSTMHESAHAQAMQIERELDCSIVSVTVDNETNDLGVGRLGEKRIVPTGRMRTMIRIKPRDFYAFVPNQTVKVAGMPIGRVVAINDDKTVDIVCDPLPPTGACFYCSARPGEHHAETCPEKVARDLQFHMGGATGNGGHVGAALDTGKARREWGEVKPCDECKGTGWYEGFAKKEPCSKGCKAP